MASLQIGSADSMKSDSNIAMTGEAGNNHGINARKMSKTEQELMKRMDDLARQQQESSTRAYNQRQQYIEQQQAKNEDEQKRGAQQDIREAWKEYTSLGKEYKAIMKENDPDNYRMLRNLAKRILAVEQVLKIDKEDSITINTMQDY